MFDVFQVVLIELHISDSTARQNVVKHLSLFHEGLHFQAQFSTTDCHSFHFVSEKSCSLVYKHQFTGT